MSKKKKKTNSQDLYRQRTIYLAISSPPLLVYSWKNKSVQSGGRQDWYICGCGSSGSTRPENIIPEIIEKKTREIQNKFEND
jgi:hypothetical protein